MGLTWNPGAIPGLVALVTGLSMAALVYWTRPDRSQNRRLALLLGLEGVGFGALGAMFLVTSRATAASLVAVDLVSVLVRPWVYLAFLATLDSPLVDWLDNRPATGILAGGAVLSAASYFPFRDQLVARVPSWEQLYQLDSPGALAGYTWLSGPLGDLALGALLAVAVFGLVVALSVYRRTAAGSARRSTARAYLGAFGVRDTLQALSLVYFLLLAGGGGPALVQVAMGTWLPQVASVLFSLLLAYGILKTQLFEIDLKLKLGLEKSTIVGVFGVVFLAVSEIVEALVGVDGTLYGIGAAFVIGLFFRRVEQASEEFADRLMPGVDDTPEYRQQRKRELYRAAVESAVEDEEITDKERDVLARMADELELTSQESLRIERDVLGSSGGETA